MGVRDGNESESEYYFERIIKNTFFALDELHCFFIMMGIAVILWGIPTLVSALVYRDVAPMRWMLVISALLRVILIIFSIVIIFVGHKWVKKMTHNTICPEIASLWNMCFAVWILIDITKNVCAHLYLGQNNYFMVDMLSSMGIAISFIFPFIPLYVTGLLFRKPGFQIAAILGLVLVAFLAMCQSLQINFLSAWVRLLSMGILYFVAGAFVLWFSFSIHRKSI